MVGNGIVLFVSITARSKLSMDVPRFLICNLACADFMMGAYLGILAILDASTLGMTATLILSTYQSPLTIVEINCFVVGKKSSDNFFYKNTYVSDEFQFYAIKWQRSGGCLTAGFLGIVSSMLSVYTLTVITVERFYAISNAMQLNKRIGLKQAGSNSKDPIIVSTNLSKMKIAKEN